MESFSDWVGASSSDSPELLYRPTHDPATHADEWFGVMNYSPTDCLPRTVPKSTLEKIYLVVLSDPPDASPARKAILELIDRVIGYKSLPLVEIECGQEMARRVASLSGVEVVLPALQTLDKTRSVAIGIDLLAAIERAHRNGQRSNYLFGGRLSGEAPGYPFIRYEADRLIVDADLSKEWSTEPAIMPVINMSLGTKPTDYPFLRNDIVNLATYGVAVAQSQLIVISAGNCGHDENELETMSAWAQPSWVLSVGATEDAGGKILAKYSARGTPDDPLSGPDVVAWGRSGIHPYPQGTSFAAPRVSFYAMICAAALLQLRHGFQVAGGQAVEGVRLVGLGMIDSWGKKIWQDINPRLPMPALPVIGLDMNGITNIARTAAEHGINFNVRGNAEILRSLLTAAAQPIPGYEKHEVGFGFLNEQLVLDYIATLNGADVFNMFATQKVSSKVNDAVSRWHVFDRSHLDNLARIVQDTAPQWRYDWRRQRIACSYVGEELSQLSQDVQEYGIGVDSVS